VRLLAHRGDRAAGPENSRRSVLAAFRRADGAEVDVLVTADGRAVLRHDDRLANGYPVRDLPLADLRRLLRADPDDLPEVGEVLRALADVPGDEKRLDLELKVPGAARALEPLRDRLGRVVLTSFFVTEVEDALARLPGVPIGLLTADGSLPLVPAGVAFLAVRHAVLPGVRARYPDVALWTWTVNDAEAAARARAARCDVAIGDDVDALRRWLRP
jgi:glycerophosphoryl diester phosphodiesterase